LAFAERLRRSANPRSAVVHGTYDWSMTLAQDPILEPSIHAEGQHNTTEFEATLIEPNLWEFNFRHEDSHIYVQYNTLSYIFM
jgi:hypothetical protein